MVQWFLESLNDTLLGLRGPLTWLGIVCLLLLAGAALLRLLIPERLARLAALGLSVRLGARWLWPLLALISCVAGLGLASAFISHRLSSEVNARTVNQADPEGAPTTQPAPTATYLVTRTYTRSLIIPPELLRRVGEQGVGALASSLPETFPTFQVSAERLPQAGRHPLDPNSLRRFDGA